MKHIPVLLSETIEALTISDGKKYIDGTFGFGGHSTEILKKGGYVLGIDVDKKSLSEAKQKFVSEDRLTLVQDNFRNMKKVALANGFEKVDGILLDLGLSSWQLDESGRGFSFSKNEPLDMRMDDSLQVTAQDILKILHKGEFNDLFNKLGDESLARDIGLSIIRTRGIKEIKTTKDLAAIVEEVYRKKYRGKSKKNPATKVFQALRIAVNDELNVLKETLPEAVDLLKPQGRLAVITFHSLEDRIVKDFFKSSDRLEIITKKPIIATEEELSKNYRARSAKLRVAEKK